MRVLLSLQRQSGVSFALFPECKATQIGEVVILPTKKILPPPPINDVALWENTNKSIYNQVCSQIYLKCYFIFLSPKGYRIYLPLTLLNASNVIKSIKNNRYI